MTAISAPADAISAQAYAERLAAHHAMVASRIGAIEAAGSGEFQRAQCTLLRSGLFDAAYYREQCTDAIPPGECEIAHYLRTGDAAGFNPNPGFNVTFYRRTAMAGAAGNTLLHYVTQADALATDTSALFRPRDYFAAHPGLAEFASQPLFHWLHIGRSAGWPGSALPGAEYANRVDRPLRRALYEMMFFKRALVGALGLQAGFESYRGFIRLPEMDGLRELPLAGIAGWARAHGRYFREVRAGGEPCRMALPHIEGDGDHTVHHSVTRSAYLACIDGVTLRGGSSLIERENCVLFDYEGDELQRFETEFDFDAAAFAYGPGGIQVINGKGRPSLQLAEAFSLLGARSIAFGHWLPEHLLKYAGALRDGLSADVPVLIDAVMPPTHREALELLFPGVRICVVPAFARVDVARLWCAPTPYFASVCERRDARFRWESMSNYTAAGVAPGMAELARRADAFAGHAGNGRLYLARRPTRHRLLENHGDIERMAVARGYTCVYPEDAGFAEQVRLVRSARFIIAPQGSAIFLMFFAQPGTRLLLLHNCYTDNLVGFAGFFEAAGVQARVLAGEAPASGWGIDENSDYRIDPARLAIEIDILES